MLVFVGVLACDTMCVVGATQGSFAHYLSTLDVFRHPFANLVNPEHVGGVNAGTQHNVPDDGVGFILALWGEARLDRWVGPMPTRVRCARCLFAWLTVLGVH